MPTKLINKSSIPDKYVKIKTLQEYYLQTGTTKLIKLNYNPITYQFEWVDNEEGEWFYYQINK